MASRGEEGSMNFTDTSCLIKDHLNTLINQIGSAGIDIMFIMITLSSSSFTSSSFFYINELLGYKKLPTPALLINDIKSQVTLT